MALGTPFRPVGLAWLPHQEIVTMRTGGVHEYSTTPFVGEALGLH